MDRHLIRRRNFIKISGAAMLLPWADAKPLDEKATVSLPGSETYKQACQIFNGRLTPQPAAVSKCLTEDEIRTGISWARENQKTYPSKAEVIVSRATAWPMEPYPLIYRA